MEGDPNHASITTLAKFISHLKSDFTFYGSLSFYFQWIPQRLDHQFDPTCSPWIIERGGLLCTTPYKDEQQTEQLYQPFPPQHTMNGIDSSIWFRHCTHFFINTAQSKETITSHQNEQLQIPMSFVHWVKNLAYERIPKIALGVHILQNVTRKVNCTLSFLESFCAGLGTILPLQRRKYDI